jgi:cytochrome bd ubiquinol oxidase subunit II
MSIAAFCVIAFMLTAYVMLDGYDLGIASVSPFIARSERERFALMRSIGPFWNGNEVWLIVAAGSLFALFPLAYASAFSGFYLPFIVVLWLLMFRGIAMELRAHFPSRLWHEFWDAAFALSSGLLVLILGIALGNLLRGLPLAPTGYFQGTFARLLNPYALLVGIFSLAVLGQHGIAFAAMRIEGAPAARALRLLRVLPWVVLMLYAGVSVATLVVRAGAPEMPAAYALSALSLLSLAVLATSAHREQRVAVFLASCAFVASLLATAAATLYPYLLPALPPNHGVSIFDAVPSRAALVCALTVTIAGSIAVLVYSSFIWRRMGGKVGVE